MKSLVLSVLLAFAFSSTAIAKNTPCSGKMGGVAYCTADGKFMCNNGKKSRSKKPCKGKKKPNKGGK